MCSFAYPGTPSWASTCRSWRSKRASGWRSSVASVRASPPFCASCRGCIAPGIGIGRVMGGLDIAQIAPDVLRRALGYLPQDTRLLERYAARKHSVGACRPRRCRVDRRRSTRWGWPILSEAIHARSRLARFQRAGRGLSGGQRTLANLARLFLAAARFVVARRADGESRSGHGDKSARRHCDVALHPAGRWCWLRTECSS